MVGWVVEEEEGEAAETPTRRLSIERVAAEEVSVRCSAGVELPLLSDAHVGLRLEDEKYAVVGESFCFAEAR